MTDAKKPTITMPDLKRDREDESNALYVMRLVQQPVLPQDAYSPNEVARLLNISKKRVYDYASSPRHPLPLRKWPSGARGSFVLRDELIEWLRDFTVLPEEHYPES
ncbi:helix-turn-helix domain-containing protein [Eggerthella lenta]|uniref:helix-turn-helix domain-containing protein n=1 Tax=Eggerthella lenta TaxID=84112 RepID=UPI00189AE0DA|nr:helix-turn-helix domain-containing protein [Eggerthella lenta]MDB1793278.1 helix-turn-helix domain-containing protein [Eggerthella lenta]